MKRYVILAAGGSGRRMNAGTNKILLSVGGKTILERSIRLFEGMVDAMVLVIRESDRKIIKSVVDNSQVSFPVSLVSGGQTRQQSVLNGIKSISASEDDIILVHDAARCLTTRAVIEKVIRACEKYGSGVPGIPAVNTMKYISKDCFVKSTVDRSDLYEIQTPQGFRYGRLMQAYINAEEDCFSATDDASLMERYGENVYITEGSRMNIKITEKEDLAVAESLLSSGSSPFRIGTGYDVHRLVENRKLILCGVEIPHEMGLLGHSDADVGLHAFMDAMLGALSMGDIGKLFPDTAAEYEGVSSILLLKKVYQKIIDAGFALVNADITLIAQRPKIGPYVSEMIRIVSDTIGCPKECISIKATTTEKLGFEGREEGIAAQAVCMLQRLI